MPAPVCGALEDDSAVWLCFDKSAEVERAEMEESKRLRSSESEWDYVIHR